MKVKLFLFASLLLAMAIPQKASAYAFSVLTNNGNTLYFDIYLDGNGGGTAYLVSPSSGSDYITGNLVIPDSVTNEVGFTYPVTLIGPEAFSGCTGMTSVTIPSTVTRIQNGAFYNCSNLTSVNYTGTIEQWCGISFSSPTSNPVYWAEHLHINGTEVTNLVIPSTVTTINDYAFIYCSGITSLTLQNSTTTIGAYAFFACTGITSLSFPSSVAEIGCMAFAYTGLTGELTIPSTVERLGEGSFMNTNLSTINYNAVNASITNAYAYYGYGRYYTIFGNVPNINIGASVDSIPELLFYGDSSLISLTVPQNVKYIGRGAFACPNLTTLAWNAIRADINFNSPFAGAINDINGGNPIYSKAYISNLTIGDQVQYIPHDFLADDTALTSVSFPASLRNIDNRAFDGTRLTSVTIPATLDTLGSSAFRTRGTLTQVTFLPANLFHHDEEYGTFSFIYSYHDDDRPTTPQTLTLGSGVRSIPNDIFKNMNINSLTLPDSLQSIGSYSFAYCNQISSVTVPATYIDYGAFYSCTALQTVTIGDSVSFIGASAFQGCPITRLTLGEGVDIIGDRAFQGMMQVDTIFVRATVPPTIISTTFQGMPTNARIMLPCGTLQDYEDAPYWNSFTRMAEPPECGNTITVLCNNPTMGTVSGGGSYSNGTVATLAAMPKNNHGFAGWTDGSVDNPRLVMVNGDASYTANFIAVGGGGVVHDTTYIDVHDTTIVILYDTVTNTMYDTITNTVFDTIDNYIHDTTTVFQTDTLRLTQYDTLWLHDTIVIHDTVYISDQGIEGTEMLNAKIYSSQGQIVVEGADGNTVTIFDVIGRVLATKIDNYMPIHFDVQTSGAYLVKIGAYPARRIVVVRR